ncbi:Uncharacterised protein [Raoultella terrigena]|uniref:Uncharacterized protein n=1 Tax=Raoultella terrigena TaxID=577 RepID=A0A4U9D9S8_RAOTE|nr:Uncharacterised protein [Raoultella terrigena]
MLLFFIPDSPSVLLNMAGAGFLVVGGPCHLFVNCLLYCLINCLLYCAP